MPHNINAPEIYDATEVAEILGDLPPAQFIALLDRLITDQLWFQLSQRERLAYLIGLAAVPA
jgi:hypothetical protein